MKIQPLKQMFSQGDGSIDEAVVCIVAGTFSMILFEAIDIQSADFNPVSFGAGMAALWGGAGALMALRKPTQPQVSMTATGLPDKIEP